MDVEKEVTHSEALKWPSPVITLVTKSSKNMPSNFTFVEIEA